MGNRDQPLRVGEWLVEPRLNRISRETRDVSLRPQAMDLLVYLAGKRGQVVSADTLIDEIWGGVVVSSGSVYNCISELRQALSDSKDEPEYIETISKRGYRLVATAVDVIASETLIKKSVDASIAVLPFVNFSSDQEQEYFSDGIAEELLNVLAKVPNLQVAARMSSFQFKGENRNIVEIGQRLNVAHILEGSVRKSGVEIRITAQLIDARNGFHLWSETYDRKLENIFAIQDEISAAIVTALKDRLGLAVVMPPKTMAAVNIEAHDACLRGKYLVEKRRRNTIEAGVDEFKKAISIAPDYAPAYAELAIATQYLSRNHNGNLPHNQATSRAIKYAERALELDRKLAESHAAMGVVLWNKEKLEEGLKYFQNALRLNPNYAKVHDWMGMLLGNELGPWEGNDLGRYHEAFAAREKSIRLDPLSLPANNNYIIGLIMRNRVREAEREMDKLLTISPPCHANKEGVQTSLNGGWANTVLAGLKTLDLDPEYYWVRNQLTFEFAALELESEALTIANAPPSLVYSMLGKPEEAAALAKLRLEEEPDSNIAWRNHGLTLAGVGNYACAEPILEDIWLRNGKRITAFGLVQNACAAALIAIRRAKGNEAGVGELLRAFKTNVEQYQQAGISEKTCFFNADYEDGLARFLAGNQTEGIALIAKSVEEGYFILPNEAYLKPLYDHADFAPLRAIQEIRQKAERKKFLAIVCPDNPYAAIWKPTEQTLKRFGADCGS